MTVPGVVLAQPLSAATASKKGPRATSSPESALTSRLARSAVMRRAADVVPPALARRALALPHPQAPEVAPNLARVDLPPRKVHVRAGDQPALVARQRHPLGQHVIGVRQPRAAVRARLVGERDAVLVEQR